MPNDPDSPVRSCQADSLWSEPPGKPKNNEMGTLILLQGIFPTHRLNMGVIGFFSRAVRGIGVVRHVAPPTWLISNVLVRPASS